MREYLVEVYNNTACADSAALARLADGDTVRYLRSIVIPGDEACLHLVLADSIERVTAAFEQIGLQPNRIVDAVDVPAPTRVDTPKQQGGRR